jgi:dUTP pyrophosphatase
MGCCNKEIDLKIVSVHEDYLPKYANETDACMDIKAYIPPTEVFAGNSLLDEMPADNIIIPPGETVKVRTGIKVAIPEDYVMLMFVRSSTGIKKNLILANGTGIIDSGYRDEIIMALHNIGKEYVSINDKDRVCQFMIIPRPKINLNIVEDNNDFRNGDRGGGIGSTGA